MRAAGIVSLLGVAVVLGSLAWLHLQGTGLSPVRDAVSHYGITPFRNGYRVATIAFAVAGVALAVGIDRAFRGHGAGTVVTLLVIFAAARAAISWFPMDAPGRPRTRPGAIHLLLAILAFGSIASAALGLAGVVAHAGRWQSLAAPSRALGWAMLACLAGMGLGRAAPAVRAGFGAIERGFYACAIAWTALIGVACAAALR